MGTIVENNPHIGDQAFAGVTRNAAAAPPTLNALATFRYRLTLNGAPIGWFGKGGSQSMWAQVTQNESEAVRLQWYAYGGVTYLTIPNFGYMTWSGGLSGKPVAFNTWPYANGWKEENGLLIAVDSKEALSIYRSDVPWLYANSGYSVVGVTRVDG